MKYLINVLIGMLILGTLLIFAEILVPLWIIVGILKTCKGDDWGDYFKATGDMLNKIFNCF